MSKALDDARRQAAEDNPRKALKRLWHVEAGARNNLAEARGLLEISERIATGLSGRQLEEAEQLAAYAAAAIKRLEVDPAATALIWVPRARFLDGTGLGFDPEQNSRWDLIFGRDQVVLRGPQRRDFDWSELVTIGVEGAGQVKKGTRWRGFGFGLQGALEGALLASALHAMTSTTSIDTVIVLQFTTAEAFLHYDELTPVALRRRLAPAFLRLRETRPSEEPTTVETPAQEEHWTERLQKLVQLHRSGALDASEFAVLKARLIAETDSGRDTEPPR